jgi:hypothetical protein
MSTGGLPNGILALDNSQVLAKGSIPTVVTRPLRPSEMPAFSPSIEISSEASKKVVSSSGAERTFDGFKIKLQTSVEDLTDAMISGGTESRVIKIYLEYGWYYNRNGVLDLLQGTLRRVGLSVKIMSEAPTEEEEGSQFSTSKAVQRGSTVVFYIIPEYGGPSDDLTINSLSGPAYDVPYFVGARIRMLPSSSISIEIQSFVKLTLQSISLLDPLQSIGPNVQSALSALELSSQQNMAMRLLSYKYGYFIHDGKTEVNRKVGINTIFDFASPESDISRGNAIRRGEEEFADGSANWPIFPQGQGRALIIKVPDGYASVLCVTWKPVNFGASIQYLGKGIVDGVNAEDPRNGVPSSVVEEAIPLNFAYISGAKLKKYIMAGGNAQTPGISMTGTSFDSGHTPIFSVNEDVDPTKRYLVVFFPAITASMSSTGGGDENTPTRTFISTDKYYNSIYITYQAAEKVLARRINLDRSMILQSGATLLIGSTKSGVYHFSPCKTIVREAEAFGELCSWRSLQGDFTSNYYGRLPSLSSAGVELRSFSYLAYLKCVEIGSSSYESYISSDEKFKEICDRVRQSINIGIGRPNFGNPLDPPGGSTDSADFNIDIVGSPISVELPRISRIYTRLPTLRKFNFPKGFFFGDKTGIYIMSPWDEPFKLFSPGSLNTDWYSKNLANISEFVIDEMDLGDMYFDISEACNSCLPDDLKIPYHKDLALAIQKSSKYESNGIRGGIGIPRLDFFEPYSSTQIRVGGTIPSYGDADFPDLSLAEFDTRTILTMPNVIQGSAAIDITTGNASINFLRSAGSIKNINLSRTSRITIENLNSQQETNGAVFVFTTGTLFEGMRSAMNYNNSFGVLTVRDDQNFALMPINSIQTQKITSACSFINERIDDESVIWRDKKITDLANPIRSKAAFGFPFDMVPVVYPGFKAVVNEADAFREQPSNLPNFVENDYNILFSVSGDGASASIPSNPNYYIAGIDIYLKNQSKEQLKKMFISACIDGSFLSDSVSFYPPSGSKMMLWYKVDDLGTVKIRGPHYGSSMNLIISSSSPISGSITANVKVRWIEKSKADIWYPEMTSASPFIDSYGCYGMYFASQNEDMGLSCYMSCDGDLRWNLMTHVMQGFSGESFSDIVVKSDHNLSCTYCMFKKDGMLLCKRIDDSDMSTDLCRLPKSMPKEKFRVGYADGLDVYSISEEPYKTNGFSQNQNNVNINLGMMKVRLAPCHVVYADFAENPAYKEEAANFRILTSRKFTSSSGISSSELSKKTFYPRISTSFVENPKLCVGTSGRFDFDPMGPYAFEVMPNGSLFCMMTHEGSAYAFVSSDCGKTWNPAFRDYSFPIRPIKYKISDADSIYNFENVSASLGDTLPLDNLTMCVDKFGEFVLIAYNIEGCIFGQRVPCVSIMNRSAEASKIFTTAWLSAEDHRFMRPFYILGPLPSEISEELLTERSFVRLDKTYLGDPSKLEQNLGVDLGGSMPTIVPLQNGIFRLYYSAKESVRAGFLIGDRFILDAQLSQ